MKDALEKDRTEFVELLLEHGVNMMNFLTQERLEGLYSTVILLLKFYQVRLDLARQASLHRAIISTQYQLIIFLFLESQKKKEYDAIFTWN